jgi:hypothetical protein
MMSPEPMMPAITLWQPWASWIALGLKTIETRTHHRFASLVARRIAIHAGKTMAPHALRLAGPFLPITALTSLEWISKTGWPMGVIVCTAMAYYARWLGPCDSAEALCDCGAGNRFGIFLNAIRILSPAVPWKGGRGIWQLPQSALDAGPAVTHEIVEGLVP